MTDQLKNTRERFPIGRERTSSHLTKKMAIAGPTKHVLRPVKKNQQNVLRRNFEAKTLFEQYKGWWAAWHRGNVCASYQATLGLNLDTTKIVHLDFRAKSYNKQLKK